jgi:signal transduction histidine kinase
MTLSGRVVLGFLLVAVGAVVISDVMTSRTSAGISATDQRHSTALESVLSLKGNIAETVQESFAYVVSRDPVEKQDYLLGFAKMRDTLAKYAEIARINDPGKERKLVILNRIRRLIAELEYSTNDLFLKLETTGTIDTVAVGHYESVVDPILAATDELVALEHSEMQRLYEIAVRGASQARINIWSVAATVVMLAIVAAGILHRTLRKSEMELAERQSLRDHFMKHTIAIQDDERRRVARELHDDTGSSLASLMIGLRTLSEVDSMEKAQELIGRLQIQAGAALDGVRRLARGLHPLALEQLGFVPAVEQYVDELMSSCGVKINVHARSVSKSLSGAVATALYRIIQEALTNAARHGGATEVNLVIDCIDDEINLVIEDDGHGMPEQGDRERGKPEGLGLQGIRERAFLLGGTLTIERNRHGGTTLRIKIPTYAGGNGRVVTDPLEDRFAAHS